MINASMPATSSPYLLIAMTSEKRGQSLAPLASRLKLAHKVITQAEELLVYVRSAVPKAIIIEDAIIATVTEHSLIGLLRRRESLVNVPIICLGVAASEKQIEMIQAGADLYLSLPTKPALLQAYVQRLLDKQSSDRVLRQELSKLREVEKEYKDADRVKEDLTHMLIHDLKSPIASVMGLLDHSIEMLAASYNEHDEDGVLELLSLAKGESQHLLTLAANILDVRRMREGHMPYHPEWIGDLSELVQKALRDATSTPTERNFDVIITPEAKRLYADPNLLRRVVTNLFSNAVKHTRRDGYIDFRAWKEGGHYMLSIRDNGEGIPEADQRRIFNAFEQSRHTVHDRYDTGMGLTFCKLAIEKHGGEIWVESKVGRGSTFYINLPIRQEETIVLDGGSLIKREL
ncbi:MAG: ATP-binding protein [Deinococcales bacterium]